MFELIIFVMFTFLVISAVIHLIFANIIFRKKYRGITITEALLILLLTYPGIAACGNGLAGIPVPLPLILGLPLKILFLGSSNCVWMSIMPFNKMSWIKDLAFLPISWVAANILFLGSLFLAKPKSKKVVNSDSSK